MSKNEEIEYILCEKYKVLKKLNPDIVFTEFNKFQPTVKILQFCNDILNGQPIKASLVQKLLSLKKRLMK